MRFGSISRSKVLGCTLIILGLPNIMYFIFGLLMGWGLYFGVLLTLFIGVSAVGLGIIKIVRPKPFLFLDRIDWKVRTAVKVLFVIFILSFFIIEGNIIYNTGNSEIENADYMIILGAGLWVGEYPTIDLQKRLDIGIEYLKTHPGIKKIILSGGQGEGEKISEAEAMKRYLIKRGIAEEIIVKEDKSTSTYENLKFSRAIIKSLDDSNKLKVVIATNDFHIFRAKLIAERLGMNAFGLPAGTPLYIIPNHYLREYFAVVKTVLLDRG